MKRFSKTKLSIYDYCVCWCAGQTLYYYPFVQIMYAKMMKLQQNKIKNQIIDTEWDRCCTVCWTQEIQNCTVYGLMNGWLFWILINTMFYSVQMAFIIHIVHFFLLALSLQKQFFYFFFYSHFVIFIKTVACFLRW